MTYAAGFHFNEDFPVTRLRTVNFLDCERLFEFLQDGSFHSAHRANSKRWTCVSVGIAIFKWKQSVLDGANEEFHGIVDTLRQSVRPSEVHGPLTNHGGVQPFHELGEVDNRKVAGDLTARLALIENLAEQPDRGLLGLAHVGRTYRIHCARQHNRPPQRPVSFRYTSQAPIKPAQALSCRSLTAKLKLQSFHLAYKAAPADFTQNSILGREITKEGRLADFENLDDVIDASILVAPLTEQFNSSLDDLPA